MIQNNQELETTLARIRHFQKQIENPERSKPILKTIDYRLVVSRRD